MQKKVITLFHFALNESGSLFLGPSETMGRRDRSVEPISKKWRMYRRIGPSPGWSWSKSRSLRPNRWPRRGARPFAQPNQRRQLSPRFAELMQRAAAGDFAPAAALINRKYEILSFFGPCAHYLDSRPGSRRTTCSRWPAQGLRTKLRGASDQAIRRCPDPCRMSTPGEARRRLSPVRDRPSGPSARPRRRRAAAGDVPGRPTPPLDRDGGTGPKPSLPRKASLSSSSNTS